MNIYFKPMLWPSIFSFIVFVMLLSFGTWQIKRLFWKEALIERYISQSQSNPILDSSSLIKTKINEFKSVEVKGSFIHDNEIYITGKTYEGNAGFHVVTPFKLTNDKIILIKSFQRIIIERVLARDNKTKEEIKKILLAQKGITQNKNDYDFIVNNNGEISHLFQKLNSILEKISH